MDTDQVFDYTNDPKVQRNAFFMWCFDDDDYACSYTPEIFACDWIKWKSGPFSPYKDENDWYPTVGWPTREECNNDVGELNRGRALFAQMICHWIGGTSCDQYKSYDDSNGTAQTVAYI